ncbi:MAG: hypothetical protein Q8R57_15315 [Bacteroidota bacterium]|nr:hypothetical protein [Bacteroidota bacterium]
MTINEINSNYFIADGQLISIKIDYNSDINSLTSATVVIKIRKKIGTKKTMEAILQLFFTELILIDIIESFDSTFYSDIKLLLLDNGEYYLSLDPFDNSEIPNNNDNFKIKARTLNITELEKENISNN